MTTARPRTLAHHLFAMACNNAWSNHRLLAACAKLTDAEFAATRTGFFPSIRHTLNHNVTVDWLYVDAIERAFAGQPPNPDIARFFEPEVPFETLPPLSEAQHAVDRRLVALCRNLQEGDVERPVGILRRSGLKTDPAQRLFAHLFQHQIHHRGQAHAMLAGTSAAPPQLDEFFCTDEAPLRAQELSEIGLSEAAIWS